MAAGEAVVTAPVAALMEGTMGTMLLTKFKVLAAAVVVGCAVAVTAVAGWRADAVGAADPPQPDAPKAAEAPKRVAPQSDKERIAELEREREQLRKQVAELQWLLAKVEYVSQLNLAAANEAAARLSPNHKPDPQPKQVPMAPAPLSPSLPLGSPSTPPTPPAPAPSPAPSGTVTKAVVEVYPKHDSVLLTLRYPETATKAVVEVYPVGDLAGNEKEGESLAKVLKATVEPKSWGADAGVEYLPSHKMLVVRQTEKGHEEVAKVLRMLRAQSAPPPAAPGKRP